MLFSVYSVPLWLNILRHDDGVVGLDFQILVEVAAFGDVLVIDAVYLVFAVLAAHQDDLVF